MVKEELVRARNTLEEQRAFNRNIVQNMGNRLITINPEGKITSSNPAALALTCYSIEESLENPIGQLIPLVELKNLISRDKILDLPKQIEGEYQRKDGRIIFIRIKISHLADLNAPGYILVFEDLTEVKEMQMTDHLIINGDEEQIKQVMWNLCINALEAMSEGILTLSLREVFSFQSGEFKSDHGGMVLDFQDEGCGIAADQINNIYDPFYTSKKDGVGLGFATVYKIVNRNGGVMDVKSTLSEGTLFTVFLPDQESVKPVSSPSH